MSDNKQETTAIIAPVLAAHDDNTPSQFQSKDSRPRNRYTRRATVFAQGRLSDDTLRGNWSEETLLNPDPSIQIVDGSAEVLREMEERERAEAGVETRSQKKRSARRFIRRLVVKVVWKGRRLSL